ncbi:MAG TPA: DegT/DnrJ/EryC1/StrS family aminotransferase [Vicinamibacterales bacterium]|nr:DegT/DnrJ/EryC1/StrS family aminotransferase [Vicinamibacterales bacterium]
MSDAHRVPFNALRPGEDREDIAAAIRRVVDSGWFVLGPEVEQFETEFARACGAAHAVGVGTGTDAITLVLRALDIGPGDEVITPPLSAAYSALAVMMAGARPVFADIDPARLTLDPAAVEAAITPRTRALLPVHLYGQAADMTPLLAMASRHGLAVVEDAAQAHLATSQGRPVGTMGVAGAFSFYPTKNLGALGDGGAVVTSDAAVAARIRRLRNGGQTTRYHHEEAGANSRLDEMQAAILRARLPYLAGWTARRRAIAATYRAGIESAMVALPPELDAGHVYHLFPVLSTDRPALQAHLSASGVETLIHYPVPIPRQPALAAARPRPCPVTDRICGQVLSLPLYPMLADADVRAIIAAVNALPAAANRRT